MENVTTKRTFQKRLKSMLKVDGRRMFTTPMFYILLGVSLLLPVLILVMTTMTGGTAPDAQNTEQAAKSFENVWQIIGTLSSSGGMAGGMDIVSMCNINMLYFAAAVLVCLFVSDDFKSGYAKNLFTVRAKKTDYVASKTIICSVGAACMFLAFFVGAIVGGTIAGLSFEMNGFNAANLVLCMLSKIALVPFFVSIFTLVSVVAKQKTWLSICVSLAAGMLLFMMIPMLTPLNAGIVNVFGCIIGSALFAVGLGAISNLVLKKTSLV